MHLNGHAMSRTRIAQKARKAVPGETMHIMIPPPPSQSLTDAIWAALRRRMDAMYCVPPAFPKFAKHPLAEVFHYLPKPKLKGTSQ